MAPSRLGAPAVCGNGVREADEECDCGGPDCSLLQNPCCDGLTCKLVAGATCSVGESCCNPDTCSPYSISSAKICRAAVSVCDLPEYCDGTSTCPPDNVLGAGQSCEETLLSDGIQKSVKGTCLKNECVSLSKSCLVKGNEIMTLGYGACPTQKARNNGQVCGNLFCLRNGAVADNCISLGGTALNVAEGTECGKGKLCNANQECVSAATFSSGFIWQPTQWSPCNQCPEIQTRQVLCVDSTTNLPVANELCHFGTYSREIYCGFAFVLEFFFPVIPRIFFFIFLNSR